MVLVDENFEQKRDLRLILNFPNLIPYEIILVLF
jgi:hypothetical protein